MKWQSSRRRIITITRASAEKYLSLGVKKGKLAVAPDAVDISLFSNLPSKDECRRIYGIGLKDKIAMYTGSFTSYAWKGLDVFLDASNKVSERIIFFAVGGTKSEIDKLKNNGKYPNVVFVEQKNHLEMPKLLSAADVLVIPNKKGKEVSELHTSPMKLFEYMAVERPIVASRITSLLEIVDEKSAVIVEPNDPNALAVGIEKAFADEKYASALAHNSKTLSLKYSWEERARIIEESINNFYERH